MILMLWQDFYGQRLAERIGQALLVSGFALGTIVGFVKQSLPIAVIGWAIGVALTILICVPPWPMYSKHPIKWRPARFSKKAAVKEDEPKSAEASPTKEHGNSLKKKHIKKN